MNKEELLAILTKPEPASVEDAVKLRLGFEESSGEIFKMPEFSEWLRRNKHQISQLAEQAREWEKNHE